MSFEETPQIDLDAEVKKFPLVFVHGMWEDAWVFENWIEHSQKRNFLSHAVSLRPADVTNIGKVSVFNYLENLENFVSGIGEVILVGHSMGALLSLKVAEDNPLVKGVALVTATPPAGIKLPLGSIMQMLRLSYMGALLRKRPLRIHPDDAFRTGLNFVEDWQEAYRRFQPESGRAVREIAQGMVEVDPEKISCPLLLISGLYDNLLSYEVEDKIAKRYHAKHEVCAGGHMLILEKIQKGSAIEKILKFVESIR